jgi:hypothetical protein
VCFDNLNKEKIMKTKIALSSIALAIAASSAIAADTSIFTWKQRSGATAFADTPPGLKMGRASTINVRTRTVTPPPVVKKDDPNMSTADKQAALNKEIEEENRRKEEANKKQMEEAKKENCKAAQMNKETVTKANAKNKDALIPKYDADIAKYCN